MSQPSTSFLTGALLFLILAGFTAFNDFPTRSSYTDEAQHFANIELIKSAGLGEKFLMDYKCTPGPVYAVIQYFLSPFTADDVSRMRLVNIFFLGACILATYLLIRRFWPALSASLAAGISFSYLFIPVTYIAAGLGLTEFCGIFFLLCSLVVLLKALDHPLVSGKLLLAALAGVLLGFAICTRQPFLAVVPALFLLWKDDKKPVQLTVLFTAAFFSLILPAYIFSVWGGWVSPYFQDRIAARFWAPEFGVLAFGYATIFMVILSPPWFRTFLVLPDKKLNVGFITLLLIANYYFKWLEFLPNKALSWQFSAGFQMLISNIFGSVVIYLSALFIKNLYLNYDVNRQQKGVALLYFCAFLLIFSCVKNTLIFGSRYLLPAIPFLILIAAPSFTEKNRFLMIRVTAAVIGFASLWFTLDV